MLFKWMKMRSAGVDISFVHALGMSLRRSLQNRLVEAIILNHEYRIGIDLFQLEAHELAGGNVLDVLQASILFTEIGVPFVFERLAAADLHKGGVFELAKAFKIIRQKYPRLSLDEVLERFISEDDIIYKMEKGIYIPL